MESLIITKEHDIRVMKAALEGLKPVAAKAVHPPLFLVPSAPPQFCLPLTFRAPPNESMKLLHFRNSTPAAKLPVVQQIAQQHGQTASGVRTDKPHPT